MNPLTPETARAAGVAARIGALGLMVVLFATMWEGDGKPDESEHWLARRAAQQSETVAQKSREESTPESVSSQAQTVAESRVLPENIAPGQYVVADSRGQVKQIRVTAGMAVSDPVEQPHYMLEVDGVTLYFIRVDEDRIADARK